MPTARHALPCRRVRVSRRSRLAARQALRRRQLRPKHLQRACGAEDARAAARGNDAVFHGTQVRTSLLRCSCSRRAAGGVVGDDIRASAYTVGKDIVFAGGRYAPSTGPGQRLLAHELAHVVQNSGIAQPSVVRRQPATATSTAAPAVKRPDFVFIMGADPKGPNQFYKAAARYYRAHLPGATFVNDGHAILADLLTYISTNAPGPVGNIYIVTHANEDGTVSFGLDAADKDKRLGVIELRGALHPVSGTASGMANVTKQVDSRHTHSHQGMRSRSNAGNGRAARRGIRR